MWKNTCHTSHISYLTEKKLPRFLFLLSLSPGFQTHVRQQNSLCPRHQDIVQLRLLTSYHQSSHPFRHTIAQHISWVFLQKTSSYLYLPKTVNWFFFISSTLGTLQGINISPKNGILKMMFLFPRWDMLVPWRVIMIFPGENLDPWLGTCGWTPMALTVRSSTSESQFISWCSGDEKERQTGPFGV